LVQFVLTLLGVLILIGGAAWALRAFMVGRLRMPGGRTARLGIIETIPVDQRRRLILVRRDQFEHLLLIGGPTDVVVEPTIFRGVPLSARTRPESAKTAQPQTQAPAVVGPPARAAAPAVEIDRERRAPAEPRERQPIHRVPPTPAAVFAPPGVPERKVDREPVEVAPLPPEAPVPLVQPSRNPPPLMQETEVRMERTERIDRLERQSLGLRAAVAGEEMQERRQPMRVVPEPVQRLDVEASVRNAAAAAVRQLTAEEPGERVGLWQARNGPRYEFFGPPNAPAEASPGTDSDLDRWSDDRDSSLDRSSHGQTNGLHGPTPEQISSLEQEMARLLGEIAGKRTS
jgi:flagellar biogenesis protein FliO